MLQIYLILISTMERIRFRTLMHRIKAQTTIYSKLHHRSPKMMCAAGNSTIADSISHRSLTDDEDRQENPAFYPTRGKSPDRRICQFTKQRTKSRHHKDAEDVHHAVLPEPKPQCLPEHGVLQGHCQGCKNPPCPSSAISGIHSGGITTSTGAGISLPNVQIR
jgi:hypothetical protein